MSPTLNINDEGSEKPVGQLWIKEKLGSIIVDDGSLVEVFSLKTHHIVKPPHLLIGIRR